VVASITFNPVATSNAAGSFNVQSTGYIQGQAMDDPAYRNWLCGGYLASTETLPMWGGVAVSEAIQSTTYSSTTPVVELGTILTRATTITPGAGVITGFAVFDQAHAMITSPQSPVPLAGSGMSVNYYRLGSGARIAVACNPSLVSLQTGVITAQNSWDFNDSVLQAYDASTATYSVTSLTWSSTNGGQVAVVMASGSKVVGVGDIINISGATNTGSGALTSINTTQVVNTFTSATSFTFLLPGTSTLWGTIGGTIVLNYGVGALSQTATNYSLNIKVLDVQAGNSMTVSYSQTTGFATWNRTGACALIQI